MLTLCINTAGHINTLALTKTNLLIAEENWFSDRNETETILPKLEKLLQKAQIKITEINALHVIEGVGGFTGLRVGISVANTIAYSQSIPIFSSNVFELWSKRIKFRLNQADRFAILIDASRQECFYDSVNFQDSNQLESFSPQIIPNFQLSNLQEKFWIGEINQIQRQVLSPDTQEYMDLITPGEAFAKIDFGHKKPHQLLEPWYGREPNVSQAKKLM